MQHHSDVLENFISAVRHFYLSRKSSGLLRKGDYIMTSAETRKVAIMEHAFVTNHKVCEAMMKVKPDKVIAAINRIKRYRTNPTFADVELGEQEIMRIARTELVRAVRRIGFICSEIRRSDSFELITPIRNEDHSYKRAEDMTNSELLKIFQEYRRLDWLIKAAKDEFVQG